MNPIFSEPYAKMADLRRVIAIGSRLRIQITNTIVSRRDNGGLLSTAITAQTLIRLMIMIMWADMEKCPQISKPKAHGIMMKPRIIIGIRIFAL
ncbi:hypothetical protein JCM14469_25410 [Desulfatiferula olefinivorans]